MGQTKRKAEAAADMTRSIARDEESHTLRTILLVIVAAALVIFVGTKLKAKNG